MRTAAGLWASDECVVAYCTTRTGLRAAGAPGMASHEGKIRLDIFVTRDLEHWEPHEAVLKNTGINEGPRRTRSNRLLCGGSDQQGPVALHWEPSNPALRPEVVTIPPPS